MKAYLVQLLREQETTAGLVVGAVSSIILADSPEKAQEIMRATIPPEWTVTQDTAELLSQTLLTSLSGLTVPGLVEARDHWKRIAEDRLASANEQLFRARAAEEKLLKLQEDHDRTLLRKAVSAVRPYDRKDAGPCLECGEYVIHAFGCPMSRG